MLKMPCFFKLTLNLFSIAYNCPKYTVFYIFNLASSASGVAPNVPEPFPADHSFALP